jgi:hypothetical protein
MKTLRGKLTYANVISTIALFLVLAGGTAFAAKEALLPRNSVGAKQLKPGSVTPKKLSKSAKVALIGAPGAQGPSGAKGAAGADGAQGPAGSTGAAGTSETNQPLAIDASASEQSLPPNESFLNLAGQTTWNAPSGPAGLLVASLEVTASSTALGGYEHGCSPTVEVLDNGEPVLTVSAGVLYYTGGNLTPANYRTTSLPTPINVLNSHTTQVVTARYSTAGDADCAPSSKIDRLRIIVEPLG